MTIHVYCYNAIQRELNIAECKRTLFENSSVHGTTAALRQPGGFVHHVN